MRYVPSLTFLPRHSFPRFPRPALFPPVRPAILVHHRRERQPYIGGVRARDLAAADDAVGQLARRGDDAVSGAGVQVDAAGGGGGHSTPQSGER